MKGDRPATSLHLPRIAQGRLGPLAVQGQWEEMAMGQTLMPCGGLTRGQIERAPLVFGTLLARLRAALRRLMAKDHSHGL